MNTIVAIVTPLLTSAIHILRVSGPDTFAIIDSIITKKIEIKPYSIQYRTIVNNQEKIDDVLLNIFVNPNSFTGEDVVEINCHGSVYLTKSIYNLLIERGCIAAKPGEFSLQALMNHKLNYYQIEGMNNLINAKTNFSASQAYKALHNEDIEILEEIRHKLFMIMGSIEVNIDYPEYDDVPQYTHTEISFLIEPIIKKLNQIYELSKRMIPIFRGLKIAIVGAPNVGKSSLLNLLSNQDKAIVSPVAGTTRDVVEAEIMFNNLNLKILDTAGIHHTDEEIEKQGISKSIRAIEDADIVIHLLDSSNIQPLENLVIPEHKLITVYNKNDLILLDKGISISTKNKNISSLYDALKNKLDTLISLVSNDLILQSDRQILLLSVVIKNLNFIQDELSKNVQLDLLQTTFEMCIKTLQQIMGREIEYDKIDELFKHFCLGK